ncbi:MAG TPA: hypothetical protein VI653_16865 [Steroidobacteraceae bacterium]
MPNFASSFWSNVAQLVFNATSWTSIAQNIGTSPATQFYISLHNADPGIGGSQTTNETAYTNYARVAVNRTSGGFTVSGSNPVQITNAGGISFAQCGSTGDTLTYWGVGLASSGAGTLLASGPIGTGLPLDFTCTLASPGVLTIPGSSFAVNNRLAVYGNAAGTLPSGLTEGTVYFVGTATGTAITLSTTTANANPVNTTSVGAGYAIVCSPLAVSNGITPSFGAGALLAYLS